MTVLIQKADGTTEPFRPEKLAHSLRRAGASQSLVESILSTVESQLTDGTTTSLLYERAFELLRQGEHVPAARYAIRKAVLELGPSGFPFERFVAELFRAKGYQTAVGVTLSGRCVPHEVDIVAQKEAECIGAELKFHNEAGYKTDIKVALYVEARFRDLMSAQQENGVPRITVPMLVTNTKFTEHVIRYAACTNLELLGWTYPDKNNLQDWIEQTHMYPVTVLTSLTEQEKKLLIEHNAGLCSVIAKDATILERVGVAKNKIEDAFAESRALCGITG